MLQVSRRSFFVALLAPFVARFLPKPSHTVRPLLTFNKLRAWIDEELLKDSAQGWSRHSPLKVGDNYTIAGVHSKDQPDKLHVFTVIGDLAA